MASDTKATHISRLVKSARWLISENEKPRLYIVSGAYLFGLILAITLNASVGGLILATIFGGFALLIMTIILTVGILTVDYPTLVKFGTSRRAALTAAAAETLMLPFILSAVLVLLTLLTEVIMQTNMPLGLILMVLIILNLLCHTFGLIAAVLIYRFGQYGMTAAWFMFIFFFTLLPALFSKLNEKSALVAQVTNYALENPALPAAAVLVVCVILDAIMLRILYKAPV